MSRVISEAHHSQQDLAATTEHLHEVVIAQINTRHAEVVATWERQHQSLKDEHATAILPIRICVLMFCRRKVSG